MYRYISECLGSWVFYFFYLLRSHKVGLFGCFVCMWVCVCMRPFFFFCPRVEANCRVCFIVIAFVSLSPIASLYCPAFTFPSIFPHFFRFLCTSRIPLHHHWPQPRAPPVYAHLILWQKKCCKIVYGTLRHGQYFYSLLLLYVVASFVAGSPRGTPAYVTSGNYRSIYMLLQDKNRIWWMGSREELDYGRNGWVSGSRLNVQRSCWKKHKSASFVR